MGAITTEDGADSDYWVDRSVIYAQILRSTELANGAFEVELSVLASLTGTFDAAQTPKVIVRGWAGLRTSAIESIPRAPSKAIIVIYKKDDKYIVPPSILKYMPSEAGVVPVHDFSDPLLAQTMDRLRGIRRLR